MCDCNGNIAEDVQRAQTIRLLDMFIIGPAMIIFALMPKLPLYARIIMVIIGAGTIAYNGYFYFKYRS